MAIVRISNLTNTADIVTAKIADSFFTKLAGLMFRKTLPELEGLLLSEKRESILGTSIHMLFMRFDICTLWINKSLIVVEKKHARQWALVCFSKKPAKYVLELNISQLNNYSIGDQLEFQYSE